MIILLALIFSIGAIFYSLEAFNESKKDYTGIEKLYLKASLMQTNNSLIPYSLKLAQNIYNQNPYTPYYEKSFKAFNTDIKIIIKDDDKFNINLIKSPSYMEVFKNLSEYFCMPRDFDKYISYWIMGKSDTGITPPYPSPFSDMNSKQDLIYATPYTDFLYKDNCHKTYKKGLWYYVDTKNQGLNINTIPMPIIKAIDKNITTFLAKEIIDYREKKPIKNIQELMNVRGISADDVYVFQKLSSTTSSTMIIKVNSSTKKGGLKESSFTKIYYSPKQNKILGIYEY